MRRPPFALVLVLIVALFGGALLLSSTGGGGSSGRTAPRLLGSGPARVCVSSRAVAEGKADSPIKAEVQAGAPVSVTETASSGGAAVTARLSERLVERALADRNVEVERGAVAIRRVCARGNSAQAARGLALTRAYKEALAAARVQANADAVSALKTYVTQLTPSTLAAARAVAESRARAAAAAAEPALAERALRDAEARAARG